MNMNDSFLERWPKTCFRCKPTRGVPRTPCFNPGFQRYFLRGVIAISMSSIRLKKEGEILTLKLNSFHPITIVIHLFFSGETYVSPFYKYVWQEMQCCIVLGLWRPSNIKESASMPSLCLTPKEVRKWHKWANRCFALCNTLRSYVATRSVDNSER